MLHAHVHDRTDIIHVNIIILLHLDEQVQLHFATVPIDTFTKKVSSTIFYYLRLGTYIYIYVFFFFFLSLHRITTSAMTIIGSYVTLYNVSNVKKFIDSLIMFYEVFYRSIRKFIKGAKRELNKTIKKEKRKCITFVR